MSLPVKWSPAAALCAAALALALVACGGEGARPPDSPYVITVQANAFAPARLEVPPGAVVLVLNRDPWLHSVTSEAAPGALAFGTVAGVGFDTGPFAEQQAFTVPAGAPPGTVVPWFCTQLREAMRNEGELVVVAPPGG